ncbi:MAG TPA: iron ABC transporter permease [Chthoniobacteraceae bacterium]|jgi:iron(III) transport system permease protein|nr:transporter permease [Chthoniobacter sp.]HEV7869039.1 iron ABC transporter permease [Chthoniobacteraceae bacterium]
MSKSFAWVVYALTGAFFACFFIWPIATTVGGAFFDADRRFTFDFVAEVFRNRIYVEGLRNAFLLALGSTLVTIAIALPLAFVSDRYDFPGKKLLSGLLLVPLILPPFVGAIGIRQLLGQHGALNALLENVGLLGPDQTIDWLGQGRMWGVIALNALHLYPILFLNVTAALANIDPAMEEAAENLGCTGFRKFRRITLPLMMPGLFAGGTIVFIFAFTELGIPLIFDITRVTSVQIFYGIKEIAGNPFPFALVVVMLTSTVLLYAVSKLAFGNAQHAMTVKASTGGGSRTASSMFGWLCALSFAGITALALLPHAGVILVSLSGNWYRSVVPTEFTLSHYETAMGHYLTVPSIINSLKYASIATVIDVILGVAIAYVVVRTDLPGRGLLDALAMMPLAVPGLVLAFGYISMTQDGRVFSFLNPSKDPTLLLVIAYSVRRLPYVVRSAVAGFQQTSVSLEEAAQNLGCPPLRALRRITLPLIAANLIAGGLLAFSFAMLEVSDSLILAQKQQHYPITKAIYELYLLLGEGRFLASALGVWAMAFLGITIFAASALLGKKLGALFRV